MSTVALKRLIINGRFLSQRKTGVQAFAISQTQELAKFFDVTIVAPTGSVLPDEIAHVKLAITGSYSGHIWEQVDLLRYLKKNGCPPLVCLSGLAPLLYKNCVLTIHDLSFLENPSWFSLAYRAWYSMSYWFLLKNIKGVITVSQYSKTEILRFFPRFSKPISVVYNRIPKKNKQDTELYSNSIKEEEYILLVSSIDPRKNIQRFVEAFQELNLPGAKLKIVGGGSHVFKSKISEGNSSNVVFLGYVSDDELKTLYSNATLFAYPSLYEGFGIPPVEAMSYGCPCVVSSASSIPEVCGDAALYFDPYDKESIKASVLEGLHCDKSRSNLVRKGLLRVDHLVEQCKIFSIQKAINESSSGK